MTTALVTGGLLPEMAFDRHTPQAVSLDDLAQLADAVREPAVLRGWLESVLRDPVALDLLAGRSYRHANGFAKIVVGTYPSDGITLRLHVWTAAVGSAPRGETDPHGHRWRFVSSVVAGAGLDVVHFLETGRERAEGPDDEFVHRFEYDPRGGLAMHSRGPRVLRAVERTRRGPRDTYRCDEHTVHTIEPIDDDVVATVVVQGPGLTRATPVYRDRFDPSVPPRLRLGVDELVAYLELVLAALPATPDR